jgi:hypothetical protein
MMIGRTDERQNPLIPMAGDHMPLSLFGCRSRNPSGPAVMTPRQQAGHMTAFEPKSDSAKSYLNPTGRPHRVLPNTAIDPHIKRHLVQSNWPNLLADACGWIGASHYAAR